MPDPIQYETLTAAALRTGVSTKTLRRRIAEGKLTAYRAGVRLIRVIPAEVDALLSPIPERHEPADALARSLAALVANHEPFTPEQVVRLRELLTPPRTVRTPDSAA